MESAVSQRSFRSRNGRCAAIRAAQRVEPQQSSRVCSARTTGSALNSSRFTSRRPPREFTENSQPGHSSVRIDVKAYVRHFSRIQNFLLVDMQGIRTQLRVRQNFFPWKGRERARIGNVASCVANFKRTAFREISFEKIG